VLWRVCVCVEAQMRSRRELYEPGPVDCVFSIEQCSEEMKSVSCVCVCVCDQLQLQNRCGMFSAHLCQFPVCFSTFISMWNRIRVDFAHRNAIIDFKVMMRSLIG